VLTTRRFGATGLLVSPIGLGLAAVGRPAYIDVGRASDLGADRSVEAMERRTHELLDAAHAAGVRYVDAARSYGLAERFLGSWLTARGLPPGSPTVGSKWGYRYMGGWRLDAPVHEVKDHSLAALERQYAESRAELGDRLLLYQVHSATLESGILEDAAVLGALDRMRRDGLAIGLTVSGPRQSEVVRRSLDVRVDGECPFGSVQATWNLLERSAGPALAEARQAGCGVILKEVLANGRLSGRGPFAGGALREVARRAGVGMDAVAIAAALANPWADVVLSGAVAVRQLESNLDAQSVDLTAADLDALAGLAEPAERYWSERHALPWS
jgi:aryl-alcohol dehydrogenase-like predicted oxidoreductase